MYAPVADIELSTDLPAGPYGLPDPEDLHEEGGVGLFQEVWSIVGGTYDDAGRVLELELGMFQLMRDASSTAEEYEELAYWAEYYNPNAGDHNDPPPQEQAGAQIMRLVDESGEWLLGGLDLGIASLVFALAAAGVFPAASCRGHATPHAWSTWPVVFFASTRDAAATLQPLVIESRCGFADGSGNGPVIVVEARSVEATLALASELVARQPQLVPSA